MIFRISPARKKEPVMQIKSSAAAFFAAISQASAGEEYVGYCFPVSS